MGSSDPVVGGTAQAIFDCDPDRVPGATAWRRLTRRQYEQTLQDLLAELVGEDDLDDVWSEVEAPLAGMPNEQRLATAEDLKGSYRRLDQAVDQSLVEAWYGVSSAAAAALTEPGRIERVFGSCATDSDASNDEACIDELLDGWGARVLRHPLDADDREFHLGFFGDELGQSSSPEAFADVLVGLLSAPQMLYQIEHGDSPDGDKGMYGLDAFEQASRLSYHFWGTLPDTELWEAAQSGALTNEGEYEKQAKRLFNDPRTRATLREFYRDWLKLEDLPELDTNVGSPRFDAFAAENTPSADLREQAIEEVLDLLEYVTWEEDGGVADMLTTPLSFAKTEELAALYGIESWDGEGAPPSFAEGERPGFLTRVAMLATGSPTTRPIMKGVFARRYVLCDSIPPPPENAGLLPAELEKELSTREIVEGLTEQPGSSCASCHATYINPLGFATEGFDSLGRVRDTQVLFDEDGVETGEAELNTATQPQVVAGDVAQSGGVEDMTQMMVDSGKVHACVARNYFRFSFGRWENLQDDGCALEQLRTSLAENDSLKDMLLAVALTDDFKHRNFSQETP